MTHRRLKSKQFTTTRTLAAAGVAVAATASATSAQAISTSPAGVGLPFNNMQDSLPIQVAVQDAGLLNGGVPLRMFAYPEARWQSLVSGGWMAADGRLLSTSIHSNLFDQIGNAYGGNGSSTFAVPDLRGRALIGETTGHPRGLAEGANALTLSLSQIPSHAHSHPQAVGGATTAVGGGQSFDNTQASLPLNWSIETDGIAPSGSTYGFQQGVVGRMVPLAGTPGTTGVGEDRTPAAGQARGIASNPLLYSLISNRFGGNGVTAFSLPDLRGRTTRGAQTDSQIGETLGSASRTLITANMPAHLHSVPGNAATGVAGGSAPFDNRQPSLGITYVIATSGAMPTAGQSLNEGTAYVGEIQAFATGSAVLGPGYAPADGRLLSITLFPDLYAVLGTTFGGNGTTNFALPDLTDRIPIGASDAYLTGQFYGIDQLSLGVAELPSHTHSLTLVPEPTAPGVASGAIALMLRRRRFARR